MINILFKIIKHPLNKGNRARAILKFSVWQLISRVYPYPILLPFTNKSNYLCWNGLTGLTGNWYYGLMEFEEMSFILHFLAKKDCFFDIGANAGAYTILASQHSECETHAFEPHPGTFDILSRNIRLQKNQENIFLHNFALGDTDGIISFTSDLDTINHVALQKDKEVVDVEIKILDSLSITSPTLIKIDVEGFEYNVLKGGLFVLSDSSLKVVIIELNGSGKRYGINDDTIDLMLRAQGFEPFTYNPFLRKLIHLDSFTSHNTIYIRDLKFCTERLNNAIHFKLPFGQVI
jgi:FkbM family methyltransferase